MAYLVTPMELEEQIREGKCEEERMRQRRGMIVIITAAGSGVMGWGEDRRVRDWGKGD